MSAIIELEDICFSYSNSHRGLQNISMRIPAKKKTVVLGLNGAGKSTLFLTICGILKPQKGTYKFIDKVFNFTKKERSQIGNYIGYVFQDPEVQLFAPTVYDDVAFGLRNKGVAEEEIESIVNKYLDFLNITHLKDSIPHELSYGQKKLVAIAGVIVMQPEVLILDEPFAWLDNLQEENMKKILEKLYEQGMSIVLSTHNLDFALDWAQYGVVLKEGKCKLEGDVEILRKNKDTLWE